MANYTREGIFIFSMIAAVAWTVVSALIFIPIYLHSNLVKASVIGSIAYIMLFFSFYIYISASSHLSLKVHGVWLFEDGQVTRFGLLNVFFIATLEALYSIVALIISFRFSLVASSKADE